MRCAATTQEAKRCTPEPATAAALLQRSNLIVSDLNHDTGLVRARSSGGSFVICGSLGRGERAATANNDDDGDKSADTEDSNASEDGDQDG